MSKILAINPTGFFSFGLHKTVILDNLGLTLLDGLNLDRGGTANGAGKTSFFNAITQILFGKNPSGECGEAVVNELTGKAWGRVVFIDNSGIKWRVTDVKKWRKNDKYPDEKLGSKYAEEPSEIHNQGGRYSGTDVYLERWDGAIWIDERATNTKVGDSRLDLKATRKKILDVMQTNYDQFMSVAYMAQQQSMKFVKGTHKERMEVLSDLCDLDIWDSRVKAIRERLAGLESEKIKHEATLTGMARAGVVATAPDESQREVLELTIQDLLNQVHECDKDIATITQQISKWELDVAGLNTKITAVTQEIKTAQQNKDIITNMAGERARAFSDIFSQIRNRPRDPRISVIETEISETRGIIQTRRFDLEQLLSGAGKCPRCRSNVTTEHLERHRELMLLEIKELDAKIFKLSDELKELTTTWEVQVSKDLTAADQLYSAEKANIQIQLDTCTTQIDSLINQSNELQTQRNALGVNPKYNLEGLAQKRLRLLSEHAQYSDRVKTWHEQKKRHEEHSRAISEAKANIFQLDEDIKYISMLDKLFGDKGMKAYKLDNIVSMLNQTLPKHVDIITDNNVNIWVSQYRQKSDGGMATDIQIMVKEGPKQAVPFDLYSGGEKQQMMLAFIGAFWQLASMNKSAINVLCLDEILGPLDVNDGNAHKIHEYLEYMKSLGTSSIIIVTHNPSVKQQIQFDRIWTVTKKDHLSTIDTNTAN